MPILATGCSYKIAVKADIKDERYKFWHFYHTDKMYKIEKWNAFTQWLNL